VRVGYIKEHSYGPTLTAVQSLSEVARRNLSLKMVLLKSLCTLAVLLMQLELSLTFGIVSLRLEAHYQHYFFLRHHIATPPLQSVALDLSTAILANATVKQSRPALVATTP
jgi:EamA domain-containing membrane protein RarD